MKKGKSFKLSSLLVLMFILTALFSVGVFAADLETPDKVTGLKQTDASKSGFAISWDASPISGVQYEVYLSTDGAKFTLNTTVQNPKASIYSLSEGHTYYVAVRAFTSQYNSTIHDYEYEWGAMSDVIDVVTSTGYDFTITQTDAKTNSITLKWNAVSGATAYRVCIAASGSSTYKDLGYVRSNTTTLVKLSPSARYNVQVYPVRVSSAGYVAGYTYGSSSIYGAKTVPAKIKQVEITQYYESIKEVKAEWTDVNADGYEIQLYTYNGKKPTKKLTSTSSYEFIKGIKRTSFYKYRVRGYVTIGTAKKYGAWSAYKEFAQPVEYNMKSTTGAKKTIPMSWKKVKGAKNYTIYMSTSKNSGYKKIATTKKTSYKIKKFKKKALKYNKNYYIYVVANRKSGKKTIKSANTKGISYKIYKTYIYR